MKKLLIGMALLIVGWLVLNGFGWAHDVVSSTVYAVESGKAMAARDQLARADVNLQNAFELAAQAVEPSVVSVLSSHAVKNIHWNHELPKFEMPFGVPGDMFKYFRKYLNEPPSAAQGDPQHHPLRMEGLGSGVIVTADGYILTNNHVVDAADQLTVQLSDSREFKAKVIGTDSKSDLAVIKIDATNLTPAMLGDSDTVHPGQWVMAVGSPFGLRETVTAGIVSAVKRANMGITDYESFIQTDAAINQGNSGGPLLDLHGRVIGINTAIVSRTGGFQGIGMAIPINMAHKIMDELIKTGKVSRAWLGAVIQPLTRDLATSFGYKEKEGILVAKVEPNGPGAKAGLKSGDIVISIDGQPVRNVAAFRNEIAGEKPGSVAVLKVWRDGKEQDLKIKLEQMPGMATLTSHKITGEKSPHYGIELSDATPALIQRYGLGENVKGVVVNSVESGSLAEMAGLTTGDVILQVQGKDIHSAKDATEALKQQDLSKGVRLLVQHGEMSRFVVIKAEGNATN